MRPCFTYSNKTNKICFSSTSTYPYNFIIMQRLFATHPACATRTHYWRAEPTMRDRNPACTTRIQHWREKSNTHVPKVGHFLCFSFVFSHIWTLTFDHDTNIQTALFHMILHTIDGTKMFFIYHLEEIVFLYIYIELIHDLLIFQMYYKKIAFLNFLKDQLLTVLVGSSL